MRQKTQKNLFDNIMWYIIYMLPILMWAIISFRSGEFVSLGNAMTRLGFDIYAANDIMSYLDRVFSMTGVLPLFASYDLIVYFTYFISVYLVHLFVDFILWLPRLAHKWLNKLYGGD